MSRQVVFGHHVICGDVFDVLPALDAGSVHCCVTSPPYWGLRDYGVDGQLGLEPTPDEYVARMVAVFREVWRVLRDDGTLWLNLGDSYSGSGKGPAGNLSKIHNEREIKQTSGIVPDGLKPKDLIGIPWRVAFALQADGWYLRSDIIWSKPNPMPESVTDRPTKAHEYLFLMTKQARYWYDADAVAERQGELTRRAASFRNGGVYTAGRSFDNDADASKDTHGDGETGTGRNRRTVTDDDDRIWMYLRDESAAGCLGLSLSEDGGRTWTGPHSIDAPPPGMPGERFEGVANRGACRGKMAQLPDGTVLWPLYAFSGHGKPAEACVYASADGGVSWGSRSIIAQHESIEFNETSLQLCPSGKLIAWMRTGNLDGYLAVAHSLDGGMTWSDWGKSSVWGHPFTSCALADGRVALIYGHRREPFGVRMKLLEPECTDVEAAEELVLRTDGCNYDLGYPWVTPLADGNILCAYYINHDDGTRYIAGSIVAGLIVTWALRPNIRRVLNGTERLVGRRARRVESKQ